MTRDAPRCSWCHRAGGEMLEVRLLSEVVVTVHPEHAQEARRYYDKVDRFSRDFIFSALLGCAAPLIFLAFRWLLGIAASLVYLGIIVWLFPFATPTTTRMLGIRSSVRVARVSALLFIIGGMLLLGWL